MKQLFSLISATLIASLLSFSAFAVQVLQLDIIDGVYDTGTETIVTGTDGFTVVAYGKLESGNGSSTIDVSETHYVSVALTPKTGPTPTDIGSFVFNGTTYDINDMIFGVPPIEDDGTGGHDGGDLGKHDIFETFFLEVPFSFDSNNDLTADQTRASVNTQDTPGTDPTAAANAGSALAFVTFDVDVSDLLDGFGLHFDLYNTKVHNRSDDIDVDDFAPFSHDAAFVGEAQPLTLLAIGVLCLLITYISRRQIPARSRSR